MVAGRGPRLAALCLPVLAALVTCSADAPQEPDPASDETSPVGDLRIEPLVRKSYEVYARQKAARIRAFRGQFEQDAPLSAKARLEKAADVTAALREEGHRVSQQRLGREGVAASHRIAVFPSESQLVQFAAARPWAREYWRMRGFELELRHATRDLVWPTEADFDELRKLISRGEPDVRALAIEALATLHDPSDAHRIAAYLDNREEAVPVLLPPMKHSGIPLDLRELGKPKPEDPIVVDYLWRSSQVKDYAERALRLMTGHDLDRESYRDWAGKRVPGRETLWYWQQRFQRELDAVDIATFERPPGETWKQWSARREQARCERRAALRKELAKTWPEVEAKVRLLAHHRNAGGADLTQPEDRFFDGPAELRLSKTRLLGLLDGHGLWNDVNWGNEENRFSRPYYNRMVERIALSAETLYQSDDAAALKALFERNREKLWWSGQAAFVRGISRLLPPARPGQLDDPDAREGWLRQAIRDEKEVSVRGYAAGELVRVGLPDSWPFLKTAFFAEEDGSSVRTSIIIALGKPPLSQQKRDALLDLLEDERFHALFTRPARRAGGDLLRLYAICSLNDHAGRELIPPEEGRGVGDELRSQEVLDALLKRVLNFAAQLRQQN